MNRTTYLARNGKISGPFTVTQIEEFRANGRLSEYRWIFSEGARDWQPLDPPPPPPTREENAPMESKKLSAILHDFHTGIAMGQVRRINEQGCEVVSMDRDCGFRLGAGTPVALLLVDSKSGKETKYRAQMNGIVREKAGWVFRVSFNALQ
ncbi:MAG: hypothetical protein ACXWP5_06155 [Bdellovibrionota bacterium]